MGAEKPVSHSGEKIILDYRLSLLKKSLGMLAEETYKIDSINPPDIYLFGSLGRRIAISESENWPIYQQTISSNKQLSPRMSIKNNWDVDVAVPIGQIEWPVLANISKNVSQQNNFIEIDPHLIDIDTGNRTFSHSNTLISTNYFKFEMQTFDFSVNDNLPAIKVPDMWSQLLFYLTSKGIRPRDISEIQMLAKGIINSNGYKNKARVSEAKHLLSSNDKLFSLNNIVRWPYWIAVPYDLRVKIAKFRGRKISPSHNYDKTEPVYF